MSYSGLSGQYGSIPKSIFRSKYEITDIDEPASVDEYMRNVCRDRSCDATFFESDHKREDTHSEEFLSLRHSGHRSGEVPDAPDMFLELTGRDPRGTQNNPDFSEAAKQTWQKRDSFKFYSDSDMSVTEREKRPQQLISQIREQFQGIKDRLKIFDTSKDAMMVQYNAEHSTESRVGTSNWQRSINFHENQDNINKTTQLSNSYPLGWEQTGDHEFKVASYGQIRSQSNKSDADSNRRNTDKTESQLAIFRDQVVTSGLANLMRSVVANRQQRIQNGEWIPGLSRGQAQRSDWRPRTDPLSRNSGIQTDQQDTEVFKSIERFIGELNRQSGVMGQNNIETQLQVIQFMDHATRTNRASDARFNAQDIVMSVVLSENFGTPTAATHRGKLAADYIVKRQIDETTKRFESHQVARLGRSQMTSIGDKLSIGLVGEGYKSQSAVKNNTQSRAPDIRNPYSANATHNKAVKFNTGDRHTRGLGSKFMRDKMHTDRTLNAISESS